LNEELPWMDSDYKVAKGKRLIDKIDDINYFSVKLSDFNGKYFMFGKDSMCDYTKTI